MCIVLEDHSARVRGREDSKLRNRTRRSRGREDCIARWDNLCNRTPDSGCIDRRGSQCNSPPLNVKTFPQDRAVPYCSPILYLNGKRRRLQNSIGQRYKSGRCS